MSEIAEEKKQCRGELLRRRAEIADKEEKDNAVFRQVLSFPRFQESKIVYFYASKPEETDTKALIAYALQAGKCVCLPRCMPQTALRFYQIQTTADLEKGNFGTWEPITARCNPAPKADICFVPGVAFDKAGYRMGYGKGYYDRFLSQNESYTAGLCYTDLLVKKLPAEAHDKRVHAVITEKRVLYI